MASEHRDHTGSGHVSALERRSRLLLRAYPAGYRRDRGEEIIGTLLEATPPGRSWLRARDTRALIVGGLKARAAQNRRLTSADNLRIAVMVGVALYLSVWIGVDLRTAALDFSLPGMVWPALLVGLPLAAALVLAWTAPRIVVLAGALPAAVAVGYFVLVRTHLIGPAVVQLASLAGLVALISRTARPSRRWLWLVGVVVAPAVLPFPHTYLGYFERLYSGALVLAIFVISILWAVIDARLIVAIITYLALTVVQSDLAIVTHGFGIYSQIPPLLIVAAVAALAVWLLRRQSAKTVG
jgi:hypothetical protein